MTRALYRYAAAPVTPRQAARAAVMAHPGALASHLTAAALFGLAPPPLLPHITVPPGASARTRIAKVHRSLLLPSDRVAVDGVACTGPARTLLDAATLLTPDALADLVDDTLCRPLCSVATVARLLDRPGRGVPGRAKLRAAIEPWLDGVRPGSPAEMRLVRRIIAWGFPPPVRQHAVHAPDGTHVGTIDLAWPDRLLGLEYDSLRWHNPRHAAHDLVREDRLRALGWRIERADVGDTRPSALRLRVLLQDVFGGRRAA